MGCGTKKRSIFATEQDRPDVAIAREVWRAAQAGLDFNSLVFVDETGTTTSMTRLRGWGEKGKPLLGKAPHGHWMTSTFVAGLRHNGIAAPMSTGVQKGPPIGVEQGPPVVAGLFGWSAHVRPACGGGRA